MDDRDDVAARGRRRLLIVDDDVLILAALERQLSVGHDVTVLEDPAEALGQLREGARFDVILCDLMMPTMTGVQFHAELARFAPGMALRTVMMTGGACRREVLEILEAARIPMLAKPFDLEMLRRLIETLTAV